MSQLNPLVSTTYRAVGTGAESVSLVCMCGESHPYYTEDHAIQWFRTHVLKHIGTKRIPTSRRT